MKLMEQINYQYPYIQIAKLNKLSIFRWCMQLAKDQRIKEIVVQTDALAVVECIRGSNSIASIEHIVADCKTLMNAFSKVSVSFISRFECFSP